jgi:hypothetical protein
MTNTAAQSVPQDSHQFLDRYNLLYHIEVARRLRANPQAILARAQQNLERWLPAHANSFSEHALQEWRSLLERLSLAELTKLMTEDSDEGQRLRQSTPFTGILTENERDELWRRCAEGTFSRTHPTSESR